MTYNIQKAVDIIYKHVYAYAYLDGLQQKHEGEFIDMEISEYKILNETLRLFDGRSGIVFDRNRTKIKLYS